MNEVARNEEIMKKGGAVLAQAEKMEIATTSGYVMAGGFVSGLRSLKKEIEATFEEVVAATHRAHKEAIKARDTHLDPVEKAIAIIKKKLGGFLENAEAALELSAKNGKMDEPLPKLPGISFRKGWTFRIVDAAKIPRAYLCPDEKVLRDYANAMGKNAKVSGVEFIRTTTLAISETE